jgi:hypothetical protein
LAIKKNSEKVVATHVKKATGLVKYIEKPFKKDERGL